MIHAIDIELNGLDMYLDLAPDPGLDWVPSHLVPNTLVNVEAGFLYKRKDTYECDQLGTIRNPTYGQPDDPIVVRTTYFVDNTVMNTDTWNRLNDYHTSTLEEKKLAEIAKAKLALDRAASDYDRLLRGE